MTPLFLQQEVLLAVLLGDMLNVCCTLRVDILFGGDRLGAPPPCTSDDRG